MKKIVLSLLLIISLKNNAQITDVVTNIDWPQDIITHNNDLYIVERSGQRIIKTDLTDATHQITTLVSGMINMYGVAIHTNYLYFSQNTTDKIFRIDLTATNPTPELVLSNALGAYSIAFKGDELYICERSNNKIVKINVTESNPVKTDVVTINTPEGLFFNGDDLYVSGNNDYKIYKVDTNNPNPTATVLTALSYGIHAQGMTVYNNELYFTQANVARVSKIDLSVANASPEIVVDSGLNGPRALAISGSNLFISDSSGDKISQLQLGTLSIHENTIADQSLSLVPNPANNVIQVRGLQELTNYSIYSYLGKKISSGNTNNNTSINIESLEKGVYFIHLEATKSTLQFIKI